jgi:hypothetical protein
MARRLPGKKKVIRYALLARLKRSSKRPLPSDRDRGIRTVAPIEARKSIRDAAAANKLGDSDSSQCATSGSNSIDHGDTTNDVMGRTGSQPFVSACLKAIFGRSARPSGPRTPPPRISESLVLFEDTMKKHLARPTDTFAVFEGNERGRARLANAEVTQGAVSLPT